MIDVYELVAKISVNEIRRLKENHPRSRRHAYSVYIISAVHLNVRHRMNPLRAIGYFGIVILFLADLVAIIFTLSKHDWYGAVVTVVFLIVLGILAHALRTAAKWEQHPERKANLKLGWFGQSLSAFVLGPVLHTPEGLVLVIGSAISLLFGLLAWFAPSLIALNPARSSISATMFGLWPICAFVFYVKLCAPLFRPSVFTVAVMLVVTCLPFYQAYK